MFLLSNRFIHSFNSRVHGNFILKKNIVAFSTINQDEVKKFDKISKEWWNSKSTSGAGPLHGMNPVRVDYIRRKVIDILNVDKQVACSGEPFQGLRIADIGCGGGLLSESLARLGANVVSIDPSQENIRIAIAHKELDQKTQSIEYRNISAEQLLQEDGAEKFDIVCSLEVIEHVDNLESFHNTISKLLNPGGLLFVSTINRTLPSYMISILAAEYLCRLVPVGTHQWSKFVQPHELLCLTEKNRLQVKDVSGFVFDPFTGKWTVSQDCLMNNYIVCARK